MWCLSVKCHFVNALYIQTYLTVNCLPATSDHYYHTYVHKWWYVKKKKIFFLYFHIREVLSHSRECGSWAAFPGGSRMIREGSHVWKSCCNQPKIWAACFYLTIKGPKHADGKTNSADPDQTPTSRALCLPFQLTDRPGQTVQTQIRLLLEEQSDQGLHYLPFHLHHLDSLLYGRATLLKF